MVRYEHLRSSAGVDLLLMSGTDSEFKSQRPTGDFLDIDTGIEVARLECFKITLLSSFCIL